MESSGMIAPPVKRETSHFQPHQLYPPTVFSQALYWKAIKYPDKTGWLKKLGLVVENWKKRWFCLTGDYLFYSRAPTAWHCKGKIYLSPEYAEVERYEDAPPLTENQKKKSDTRSIFVIQTKGIKELSGVTRRTYYFKAKNEIEREEWFSAIWKAINGPESKIPEPRLKPGAADEITFEDDSFSEDEYEYEEGGGEDFEFIREMGEMPNEEYFDVVEEDSDFPFIIENEKEMEKEKEIYRCDDWEEDDGSGEAASGGISADKIIVLPQEDSFMGVIKKKLKKHKIKKCRNIEPLVVGTVDGMLCTYFTPEKLKRPDGTFKLKVKLHLVHTGIWQWTPSLVKEVISPNLAEYGLVHAALQFGPYILDWNISSLITPRPIKSGMEPLLLAEFKDGGLVYKGKNYSHVANICKRICHVSVRWNQKKYYSRTGKGHCHYYVNDVLQVLGIKPEFTEPLQTFINYLRKYGTSDMRYKYPISGEKTIFRTHKQLDDFVKYVLATYPNFPFEYPGDWQLLKAFDRAFWAHSSGSRDPYSPKGRECPFSNPHDTLKGSFYGVNNNEKSDGKEPQLFGVEH